MFAISHVSTKTCAQIVHILFRNINTKQPKNNAGISLPPQKRTNSNGWCQRLDRMTEWKQNQWKIIPFRKILKANNRNRHHAARLPFDRNVLIWRIMIDSSYNLCILSIRIHKKMWTSYVSTKAASEYEAFISNKKVHI